MQNKAGNKYNTTIRIVLRGSWLYTKKGKQNSKTLKDCVFCGDDNDTI